MIVISCNSSKQITEAKIDNQTGEQIALLTEFIANDTIFINDLKNHFPDLKTQTIYFLNHTEQLSLYL